ncbi:hypothetical protein I3843_15G048900 [Carya illinoinensis]|nr:hypothetical protein I3843_15G048900 [Carya illinoinensis]
MEVIPGRLRKAWELWNIRVVILISIILQIILFLGAPMRKSTGNRLVILLVWSSYFLAEWTTNFALGLITSGQSSKHGVNSDLYAFWTSFLLLHHGGPDTITAFEENELWLRHLLTLISQVVATLFIFLQTLPESKLWLPTSLIFFTGIIKYAKRTRSLYLASWRTFRETMLTKPDPGPVYAKLMESLSSKKKARLPTAMSQQVEAVIKESKVAFNCDPQQSAKKESLTYFEVVKYAYKHFHNTFVGLVVDLTGRHDRHVSRSFFCNFPAEDALKVLEVELNFIYEILYTKVYVVHSLKGYIFRLLTILSVWASLAIFCLDCKQGLDKFDIRITYTLLIVASSLETIALFNLIFSDWTTASLDTEKTNPFVWAILTNISNLEVQCEPLGAQDFLDELKYASRNAFTKDLWRVIFCKLHGQSRKVEEPENIGKMSSTRGAYVLEEYRNKARGGDVVLFKTLKTYYIENVTFDESLLLWHIATELCYHGSEVDQDKKAQPDEHELGDHGSEVEHELGRNGSQADHKFISKLLSDYMLYLLVMKPTMMSAVTGPNNKEKVACENLLAVNTEVKPIYVKGDKSKSVLFDACMLAKDLKKLEEKTKWEVISKVWVEMLAYASNHSKPDAHTKQVSRGGQLINLVWLLMAHFGLAKQFVFSTNFGPAKLIVGK